ncbi:MAG: GNAT family N-acetyltransferase [Treponema sp.]|nr:GNAT family N-acetyltransferase [Treponema sp.]
MLLHYTADGFLVILPGDDPRRVVDAMLETGYSEEFCIALNFRADFVARLMKAGFLVMSLKLLPPEESPEVTEPPLYALLPKLHLVRSALFFDKLHIKKSIERYLPRFELRFDADFERIVDRCVAVHGDEWLTPPLIEAVKTIRRDRLHGVYPASFALYRDGKLVAGEFGVIAGRVYTSYSGYYDESNAGTVQLVLTARYLEEHGFAFFDLGMPLPYKTDLGAIDISPQEFVELFRAVQ